MDPQQNNQPQPPVAVPTESFTPSEVPPTTATTTIPPQQNPVPDVAAPKKNNMLLMVAVIVLLLILVAVGGFLIYKNSLAGKNGAYTPVPQATVAAVTPTITAISTPTPSASTNGTISGNICYPASGIPAGKIVVKDTTTNQLTSFENASNSATFSVNVPSGQYNIKYEPTAYPTVVGYYTSCTGAEPACQDTTTKRTSIPVIVTSNTDSSGVKLCDYYYTSGMEPSF